ncbi:MAG TPA: VIT domain-containing protein [Rhodocyclaceae bacterium]|nr:VIT domain-containing protein [Rhodocyclaceae bacterium]
MPASPEPLPPTTPHLIFHLMRALMIAIGANLAVGLLVFLASPGAHAAGGGTLLLRGADGEVAAPTLNTEVDIRVAGPLARARVAQVFHNDGENWQEGRYVFPLPENAAVDRLHIRIGDRVIEGEIQPREQAAQTYAPARAAGQRTALVEQERPNIFTTSIANIGPGESIRVEIEYQQTLAYTRSGEHGRYSLRFPMVVAPRYIPSEPAPLKVARPQRGWARDGDEAADAARITPPVRHPDDGPINPVALRVEIEAGVAIGSVRSAFHPVNVERPGPSRRITMIIQNGSVIANRLPPKCVPT